jgi:hypothetical protein
MHVFCNAMWKRYALTNRSFQSSHGLMLHHCAPKYTIIVILFSKPDSLMHMDVSRIRWFDLPVFRLEAYLRVADNSSSGLDQRTNRCYEDLFCICWFGVLLPAGRGAPCALRLLGHKRQIQYAT